MSDEIGTFEHADHEVRPAIARLLHRRHGPGVGRRGAEPQPDREVLELGRLAFRFLADAQGVTG